MGYIPSRGNESYDSYTFEGYAYELANCFAHACLNLKNNQYKLNHFNHNDCEVFRSFLPDLNETPEKILKNVSIFLKKSNLLVSRCDKFDLAKENQWKVAFYYSKQKPDFHFMLQEKDGRWSSKQGASPEIEHFDALPIVFEKDYRFHSVLMITNPACKINKKNLKENSQQFDKIL
ncbi:MAG: hypothetical protein J6K97_02750 [Clostridia bacterium]|nr:hypothetical protein [Clostridia bacterium]